MNRLIPGCVYVDPATGQACRADALYEITDDNSVLAYAYACAAHVGALLADAPMQVLTRLDLEADDAAP